ADPRVQLSSVGSVTALTRGHPAARQRGQWLGIMTQMAGRMVIGCLFLVSGPQTAVPVVWGPFSWARGSGGRYGVRPLRVRTRSRRGGRAGTGAARRAPAAGQ